LIVDPLLADAPVMLPVIVPIVHAKLPGTLDVKANAGLVPLQILVVNIPLVITGLGLTVTVIVYGEPPHEAVVEVGVTIYCTVPAAVLLGLVNI
jgi:hypothetical protein